MNTKRLNQGRSKWGGSLIIAALAAQCSFGQQVVPAPSPKQEVDLPEMKAKTPSQQLFFCTTRIDTKRADGSGTGNGTGFIYRHELGGEQSVQFIVTCRHVVSGSDTANFAFVRATTNGEPVLGQKVEFVVTNLQSMVFYNPDPQVDVALIPFFPMFLQMASSGQPPFFRALGTKFIPNKTEAENLSAVNSVLFLGYPIGLRDEKNLLPIARRGFTASPYVVDFNGLPLFLIDANVYPGSSGSPVVVLDEGGYSNSDGPVLGSRFHFLGIVTTAYFREADGRIEFKSSPSQFVPVAKNQQFVNLGGVIKAKAILQTVEEFLKVFPPPKPTADSTNNP
jgi:hypothetical protein